MLAGLLILFQPAGKLVVIQDGLAHAGHLEGCRQGSGCFFTFSRLAGAHSHGSAWAPRIARGQAQCSSILKASAGVIFC